MVIAHSKIETEKLNASDTMSVDQPAKSLKKRNPAALTAPHLLTDWDEIKKFYLNTPGLERRSEPRLNYKTDCKVIIPGVIHPFEYETEILDISDTGIGIKDVNYDLVENDYLQLVFRLPDAADYFETEAIVLNKEKERLGLKFQYSPEIKKRIMQNLSAYADSLGSSVIDKRRSRYRFDLETNCVIHVGESITIPCMVKNISTMGVGLIGIKEEEWLSSRIVLELNHGDEKTNFEGLIVWSSGGKAGVKFTKEMITPINILFDCNRQYRSRIIDELLYFLEVKIMNDENKASIKKWEKKIRNNTKHPLSLNIMLRRTSKKFNINIPETDLHGSILPEEQFNLTHPQLRIWYFENMFPESCVGNLYHSCRFTAKIDFPKMKKAINLLVKNYESLRFRIKNIDGKPKQYAASYSPFKVEHYNFNIPDGDRLFRKLIKQKTRTPLFKYDSDLFYFATLVFPDGKDGVFFGVHHTMLDEFGVSAIVTDVKEIYNKLLRNEDIEIKENFSYRNYIYHEKAYMNSAQFDKDKIFWLEKLKDHPDPPLFKKNIQTDNLMAKRREFYVSQELNNKINQFCAQEHTSIFRLFLGALYTYMTRITGKKDLTFGSTFHNRFSNDIENVMGMMVSTDPFRLNISKQTLNFRELLGYIRNEVHEIKNHQEFPYDLMIKELKKAGESTALFNVLLNYHNMTFPIDTDWYFHGSQSFPVVINISHRNTGGRIKLEIDFKSVLFTDFEAERLYQHLINIVNEAVKEPEKNIFDFDIISKIEKQRLLYDFNDTFMDYSKNKTVHSFFELQVKKKAKETAIVCGGKNITYKELNTKANQLAALLINKGMGRNKRAVLFLNRSIEIAIAIFAVLKAGGAYLPLDPAYPQNRIEYIITNSDAELILTTANLKNKIQSEKPCLLVDSPEIYKIPASNPEIINTPEDLLYVIYTSGSTGKPKGVMLPHRALVNFRQYFYKNISFFNKVSISLSSFSFDVFGLDFLLPLTRGLKVILTTEEEQTNPSAINKLLLEHRVDIMPTVPSKLKLLLETNHYSGLKTLKTIISGGEDFKRELLNNLKEKTNADIYNAYGPTETTIIASMKNLTEDDTVISIGKPIGNLLFYVLDRNRKLLPYGEYGELYISGEGLARGYLNRSDLTEERFLDNPFMPRAKMYKTGDLVRWLPDGEIEFAGRVDFQVKVRGYRVELEEIEKELLKHKDIKEAVVITRLDPKGNNYLCAYVESVNDIKASNLKAYVTKDLPDYMVPTYIIIMDKLPLNTNGKINRAALPEPDINKDNEKEYKIPKTDLEKKLVEICKEKFNIEHIGVDTNFMDAGAFSLSLILLVETLKKIFDRDIPLVKLYQYPTISKLADYLRNDGIDEKELEHLSIKEEKKSGTKDIAVIGIAGRFPGAKDIHEFWNNLVSGKETITFFSTEELIEAGCSAETINQNGYVKAKGFLKDIEYFDADFFGYSKRDAQLMDPQVRIFHEVVYHALENSGYIMNNDNKNIALFAGASDNFYWLNNTVSQDKALSDIYRTVILNKDFLSTRLAYKLNLEGPAYTLQTACSTSLVAVSMAVKALQNGDCDMAVAGGVSISLPQKKGYQYREGFILSKDGHCKAFDASASGTVLGEGAGAVVLKSLENATRDKDHIWGVIKGAATNNDGTDKMGYTAPSITGQSKVIKKAIRRAGISPETITYIEAHGTGTDVGDPIEIEGLKNAFEAGTNKKQFCRIGSVKTNIGHLDAAAGVTGFIKTVLSLYHKKLPPSLHYNTPNPKIDFENSPFIVNKELTHWKRTGDTPLRAGISSFGIGGTNAHIILEEAPVVPEKSDKAIDKESYKLLLLSAKTESALQRISDNMKTFLKANRTINLNDLAYTLQVGRQFFEYRKIAVCRNIEEAITSFSTQDQTDKTFTAKAAPEMITSLENEEAAALLKNLKEDKIFSAEDYYKLGCLWSKGFSVKWNGYYEKKERRRIPLPSYDFEKGYFSIEDSVKAQKKTDKILPPIREEEIFEKEKDLTKWFYQPHWMMSVLPGTQVTEPQNFLIFLDPFGIGRELQNLLSVKNHAVTTIQVGKHYLQTDKFTYELNPQNESDYDKLFQDLKENGLAFTRVVNLFALTNEFELSGKNIKKALNKGYYCLLNITKRIQGVRKNKTIFIYNISNNICHMSGDRNINIISTPLLGAVKTIPEEYENVLCANIDILRPDVSENNSPLYPWLTAEILRSEIDNPMIAYRNNCRWVKEYTKLKPLLKQKIVIKQKGVFFITGGLGGMGLTFMEEIVKRHHPKLILVADVFPLPHKNEWDKLLAENDAGSPAAVKIKKIRELESTGTVIRITNTDIRNIPALNDFLQKGINDYGPINGIIHTAGVSGGKMIQTRNRENDEVIFAPKLYGLLAIDKFLQSHKPDFTLLCSSLNAIKAAPGQVGYCAANIFLDAYAYFARQHHNVKVVSLNWDTWKTTGMANKIREDLTQWLENQEPENSHNLIKTYLDHGIEPREGVQILYRVLGLDIPQIAVSTLNLNNPLIEEMNKQLFLLSTGNLPSKKKKQKQDAGISPEMSIETIDNKLVIIWERFLGITPIGLEDNFFDLGGDSLLAIHMIPEINKQFNINLSLSTFLTIETITQLGREIKKLLHTTGKTKALISQSTLIPLKKGLDSEHPIFLIHPVSGTIYFYHELSKHLSNQKSIYGIEARGLDDKREPLTDIEEMAAEYIKQIKQIQPRGPYNLGGSSLGGTIAYEMAVQLQKQNESVGSIIMLDTPGPESKLESFKDDVETMAYFLSYDNFNYTQTFELLKKMTEKERLNYFLSKHNDKHKVFFDEKSIEHIKRSIRLTQINSKAMSDYYSNLSTPYKGTIIFFSATKTSFLPVNLEKSWKNLLTGNLIVHKVDGNHITINLSPLVEIIAGYINDLVKKRVIL